MRSNVCSTNQPDRSTDQLMPSERTLKDARTDLNVLSNLFMEIVKSTGEKENHRIKSLKWVIE